MSDNLSPVDRRKTMQAVKSQGTKLERRLWGVLARLGLRGWKRNVKEIIGTPDVAFPDQKVVIFLDGCFWHACPVCRRKLPGSNREYWERKITRNVTRARMLNRQLRRDGWLVIRIWEHEMANIRKVKARILSALEVTVR